MSSALYYGSPYVFRGALFSSGFVMQPTVQAAYNGFFAGFFGNIDPAASTTSTGRKFAFNEADVFAGYGVQTERLAATLTYTYYTFPIPTTDADGSDDLSLSPTQEVALGLGLSAPLAPSLYVVYDFDRTDENALRGLYAEAGVSHGLPVGAHSVTAGARLALDSGYLLDKTALAHATLSLATAFEAGSLTVSPLVALQVSLDRAYRDVYARPTVFYGGIGIGF